MVNGFRTKHACTIYQSAWHVCLFAVNGHRNEHFDTVAEEGGIMTQSAWAKIK